MGKDSCFTRLTHYDTLIIGIGVDFSAHAFMHLIEDQSLYPLDVYDSTPHLFNYYPLASDKIVSATHFRYNKELSIHRIEKNPNSFHYQAIYDFLQYTDTLRFFLLGDALCWTLSSSALFHQLQELLLKGITIYGQLDEPHLYPFLRK